MPFDLNVWVAIGSALALLISLSNSIWTIFSGPSKANAKRIEDLSKATDDRFSEGRQRMDRHDTRIARLEQSLQELPTKDDMHRVLLAVEGMKGQLGVMAAKMDGQENIMTRLENVVTRHEEHLLEGKR